jgi:biopolymer transport protein ExbD
VKKSNNFIYVVIKGAGHYIYEDEPVSDKSMYLMLNNFFNKKW